MPDRDEVIKDGERAIAMLGEVEEPTPWCDFIRVSFENALALLREQEAVEPRSMSDSTWQYSCGECKKPLYAHGFAYCPWCGRRIKWQD